MAISSASSALPSAIFGFLSLQTLQNVQFTKFNYDTADDGTATISLDGIADSFSTVALQSDQFDGNKLLKNVDFTGITSDSETGRIQFSVSAELDPSVLSYSATLGNSVPVTAAPATTASTTPATPAQ